MGYVTGGQIEGSPQATRRFTIARKQICITESVKM
jgi:hypothetical protein